MGTCLNIQFSSILQTSYPCKTKQNMFVLVPITSNKVCEVLVCLHANFNGFTEMFSVFTSSSTKNLNECMSAML